MDSAAWDSRYAASADLVWTAEPNRFVVEELSGLPAGRALDLAAGEGRNSVWLAGLGWRVTGVDFSRVALERAGQLADARGVEVRWVLADVRDYLPEEAGFDAVFVAYLHLPAIERASVLQRAVRAVAPGGVLLVVGHDLANLNGGTGGPKDPAVLMTPQEIVAELGGVRVRRAETARRPVRVPEGTVIDALDTVVVADRSPLASQWQVGGVGGPGGPAVSP